MARFGAVAVRRVSAIDVFFARSRLNCIQSRESLIVLESPMNGHFFVVVVSLLRPVLPPYNLRGTSEGTAESLGKQGFDGQWKHFDGQPGRLKRGRQQAVNASASPALGGTLAAWGFPVQHEAYEADRGDADTRQPRPPSSSHLQNLN
jgi:hypothetical protein